MLSQNINSMRSLTRSFASLLSPRGRRARLAVFCYHQVPERPDRLRPTEPDRARFRSDIEIIGSVFRVLPLPDAVEYLEAGTLPSRAACITFDDGYANNHELAAPLLEKAGLPATFFVVGDAIDRGVMWNDLIIEGVGHRASNWIIGDLAGLADDLGRLDDAGELVRQILQRLKYKPLERRWELAEAFFRANTGRSLPRLMMDRSSVADLARRGFDIGGHTLRHPILKELDHEDASREIVGCRGWIKEVTSRMPRSFAYPNGVPGRDFGPEHAEMVRDAGFASAVSTCWAVAGPNCDLFSIPRIGPWWRLGSSLAQGFLRTYCKSYIRPV